MVVTRLTLNLCSTLHLLKGWNPLKCWSSLLGSDTAKPVRSPLGFSCGLLIGKTWSEITCPWLFLVPQGFHCLFYTSSLLFSGGSLWEIKIYSTDSFFLCSVGSRDSRTDAPFGSQLHPALERSPGMLYFGIIFLHRGIHAVHSRNIDPLLLWHTLAEGLMDRHFLLTLQLFSFMWKLEDKVKVAKSYLLWWIGVLPLVLRTWALV